MYADDAALDGRGGPVGGPRGGGGGNGDEAIVPTAGSGIRPGVMEAGGGAPMTGGGGACMACGTGWVA